MTCAHVLGLIDAGPFADYPRAHLDAAWRHASQCATCGPALEAARAITTDLASLPFLAPPPHLTAAVLARIATIEEARSATSAAAAPAPRARSSGRDWSAWAIGLGGLAAAVAIVSSMPVGEGSTFDIALPKVDGIAGLVALPLTTTWALVAAAGLLVYVTGLFAPVRGRGRT